MKITSALVFSTVALASMALLAAPQDFGGRQGRRGGFPQMPSPIATALDTNRDTTISASEMDNAQAALKTLDRNGDGRLAGEELMPAFGRGGREDGREREGGEGGRGGRAGEPGDTPATSPDELTTMLMSFDANHDGQLDKNEVPERMQGIFDRADLNKDGKINADEIRKSAAAASQPMGRGGREGFGREGRGEGPGRGGMTDRLLAALDTNADGVISGDEIAAAPAALRALDANKDGQLTPDEYRAAGRMG